MGTGGMQDGKVWYAWVRECTGNTGRNMLAVMKGRGD